MIDTKAIRAAAEFCDKRCVGLELDTSAILALLDRLEAAEAEVLEQARLLGIGGEKELTLMAKLEAAEKDAARLNWLEQNLFSRENIDWITKNPCKKFNMWVLFSPIGVQGSARTIIDAAMKEQK